ncbi:TIGR01777 family oxidoreductase [Desulfobotulus sp. H1]|uniref:TIGR01777 family oxidoreductase n=1 Tax=Desulfobotulus pelophilus TaxID=2823377 RepID=A0ABT3N7A5_9BACT|nr:TIGR01777 family oxidoreductase [Desulfobotulus pelophilus]MCW7753338.1 TIGR01777 family oxidoreductase [Desulfobotulus pelophilus]
MQCFVTGGAGFVGTRILSSLLDKDHNVTAVDLAPAHPGLFHEKLSYIQADTTRPGTWQEAAGDADLIINLAGRSIFHYWTKSSMETMYNSRILTTGNLVNALSGKEGQTLVSTSAIGYYGSCGDDILREDHGPGSDFLARLCVDWEDAAMKAETKGVRVICMRLGIVMGDKGGALSKMIPAYRMGLGGPLGSGTQWMPWIHTDDIVRAVSFFADQSETQGVYNLSAPESVTNGIFSATLAEKLHRPNFMRVPAFALRLFLGHFGEVLLASQRGVPDKLLKEGFSFVYPTLDEALTAAMEEKKE